MNIYRSGSIKKQSYHVSSGTTHFDKRRIASTLASVKTSSSFSCCSVVGCSQLTVTPTKADTFEESGVQETKEGGSLRFRVRRGFCLVRSTMHQMYLTKLHAPATDRSFFKSTRGGGTLLSMEHASPPPLRSHRYGEHV